MPTYDNLDDLMVYIKKETELTLKDEVLKAVKEVEYQSIQEEVYNKYPEPENPTIYNRRKNSSGLSDKKNMKYTIDKSNDGNMILNVENKTKPQKNKDWYNKVENLSSLIEYGDNYEGSFYQYKTNKGGKEYGEVDAYLYLRPRSFTQRTSEELIASGRHIEALVSGLRRRKLIND